MDCQLWVVGWQADGIWFFGGKTERAAGKAGKADPQKPGHSSSSLQTDAYHSRTSRRHRIAVGG